MRKIILTILVTILVLSITATASMMIPANDNAKDNSKAPEKSPVIGDEWDLERVDFIHYAKPVNAASPPKTTTCYKLLGVKWTAFPVNYVINPANDDGLTEEFVTTAISTSANTWDSVTSKTLFGTYTTDPAAYYGTRDYKNAISFGNYPDGNVIAVTSIWYTRVGKQIVEFDMLFDTDFTWGDGAANPALMDLQNIATHELGHAVGMADIYSTSCSTVTMYGYSNYGDLAKRTLETPDITGLQKMYGL